MGKIKITSSAELRKLLITPIQKNNVKELCVDEDTCNDMNDHLVLSEFPNLEYIIVSKRSLQNVSSLRISDCEHLTKIIIEDGEEWEGEDGTRYSNGSFYTVNNIVLRST